MKQIKIIPSQVLVHESGRRASLYGAPPWTSRAEAKEWRIEHQGWTWEVTEPDGAVLVGNGRAPGSTYDDVLNQARAEIARRERLGLRVPVLVYNEEDRRLPVGALSRPIIREA